MIDNKTDNFLMRIYLETIESIVGSNGLKTKGFLFIYTDRNYFLTKGIMSNAPSRHILVGALQYLWNGLQEMNMKWKKLSTGPRAILQMYSESLKREKGKTTINQRIMSLPTGGHPNTME